MRKHLSFILSLSLLLAFVGAASAEGNAYASLSAPEISAFPEISALLDVFDADGQFVSGLGTGDITLLEDGQPRPLDALAPFQPGARIVVAINPGVSFSMRDSEGLGRYERAMAVLRAWATSLPEDTVDNLSLITLAGPQITYARPADWLLNFNAYQPDFSKATPNLQSLAFALDTATAGGKAPGTKSAILYITPHFDARDIGTLEALQARLVENRVRVFVWLIDSENYFNDRTAVAVKSLALQTGGQYFAFSGLEPFPDLEAYFAPLRNGYSLKYTSSLNAPGEHTLEVQVKTSTQTLTSPPQTFQVDIQPPNPFLVSPPMQILRQPPPEDPYNDEILIPQEQTLEMIIEFPDGYPRPLVRTALYVDNEIVAINESEPFDRFTWDISVYTSSGLHQLKVEAVDSLGLARVGLDVPVAVTVIQPPRGFSAILARYRTPITAGAITLAGLLLLVILFWGSILRIPGPGAQREKRKRFSDPVTQPVQTHLARAEPAQKRLTRLPWARQPKVPQAPAYLVKLTASGETAPGNPIPLLAQEMTFGTDPVQATFVLDDESISPLHARLRQTEEGAFVLADQGSVAGTWLNYEPVEREGRPLEHGDILHFGQLMYRFTLRNAPEKPAPGVTPEKLE